MRIKISFVATVMLLSICALALTSCDKNKNRPNNMLKLTPSKVEVAVGEVTKISISNGAMPYTISSINEKTATATIEKNVVSIKGVKEGATILEVRDKNKLMARASITVAKKKKIGTIEFDQKNVKVKTGETTTIQIKSGMAPFTAMLKDNTIASATIVDGMKITVKGLKKGTTTITITDKNKKSGDITVTVM